MDKTVKQLADDYGMTKQAIQYHIKKLPKSCKYFDSKNGTKTLFVKPEGQDLLHSWLSKKQAEEVAKFVCQDEIIELRHKLELKELENKNYLERIAFLEKRAEEDKDRMDMVLKSLDQAQQLQAIAEQKIRLLEEKSEEVKADLDRDPDEPAPEKKKWWQFFK